MTSVSVHKLTPGLGCLWEDYGGHGCSKEPDELVSGESLILGDITPHNASESWKCII